MANRNKWLLQYNIERTWPDKHVPYQGNALLANGH